MGLESPCVAGTLARAASASPIHVMTEPTESVLPEYLEFARREFGPGAGVLPTDKGVALVAISTSNTHMHALGYLCRYLRERVGLRIDYQDAWLASHAQAEVFARARKVAEAMGIRQGVTLDTPLAPLDDDEQESWASSPEEAVAVRIEGMPVGDLLYNTYIRNRAAATMENGEWLMRQVTQTARAIHAGCKHYFAERKPSLVVTFDSQYIESGILARYAVAQGVPAFRFYHNFLITPFDPTCDDNGFPLFAKDYPFYRLKERFERLESGEREQGRAAAEAALAKKLGGQPDASIFFSENCYRTPGAERITNATDKKKIVVFLHDFTDAVYPYRWKLFPDHWLWACHVLERAKDTPYEWYVKAHGGFPKRAAINDGVVKKLMKLYPHALPVDQKASHYQLIEEGISSVFTSHGSVAHEFPYLGVPVVNAGDNMHIAYDFCEHPRTIEELDELIARAGELSVPDGARQEILEYYYMSYVGRLGGAVALQGIPEIAEAHRYRWEGVDTASEELWRTAMRCTNDRTRRAIDSYLDETLTNYFPALMA